MKVTFDTRLTNDYVRNRIQTIQFSANGIKVKLDDGTIKPCPFTGSEESKMVVVAQFFQAMVDQGLLEFKVADSAFKLCFKTRLRQQGILEAYVFDSPNTEPPEGEVFPKRGPLDDVTNESSDHDDLPEESEESDEDSSTF